jgi:hypothetical protein
MAVWATMRAAEEHTGHLPHMLGVLLDRVEDLEREDRLDCVGDLDREDLRVLLRDRDCFGILYYGVFFRFPNETPGVSRFVPTPVSPVERAAACSTTRIRRGSSFNR